MTKTVFAPHLGREVRLGGCRVDHLHVRHALTMKHVMRARRDLPVIPVRTSFTQAPALGTMLAQVFLNNQLGDCVVAARARRIGLLTGNAIGVPFVYTDAQLRGEYGRIGGYVADDPTTDNGCDPTVSADDGVKIGYADGSHDAGWVAVDVADWHEVMLANWVTNGACDLSMALPDSWIHEAMPRRDGDVWDVACAGDPNPENGHCVAVVDHDAKRGLLVDTWGLRVWVTPAAVARYGAQRNHGILIAHVNRDAIAKSSQKAPDGFDWSAMLALFDQDLGGHAELPAPTPAQPSGLTLGQAQAWAAEGCHAGPLLMTRSQAAAHAAAGLSHYWPAS